MTFQSFPYNIPTVGEMQTQICNKDIRNVTHCEQKFTKHLKFAQLPYQARLGTLLFLHSRWAWNGFDCCKQNYVNFRSSSQVGFGYGLYVFLFYQYILDI